MAEQNFGRAGGWLVWVAPEAPSVDGERRVRYDVKIVGHEAPFRWEIERWLPGAPSSGLPTADCRGEAETYDEALFEAAEVAREVEYQRIHSTTIRRETLFDCPEKADLLDDHLGSREGSHDSKAL